MHKKCECGNVFKSDSVKHELLTAMNLLEYCSECESATKKAICNTDSAIQDRIVFYDIPRLYLDAKLSDTKLPAEVLKWVSCPSESLYIFGKCGSGKSHILYSIMKEFKNKNIAYKMNCAYYITEKLRKLFSNNQSDESTILEYTESSVLVIDDFGSTKPSDYMNEFWFNIIDKRYKYMYPTLLTGNLTLQELSAAMGDRIASRLSAGIVFKTISVDRRVKQSDRPITKVGQQ